MGLFDIFKKKPTAQDELASFLADMSALTSQNGLDVDELPNCFGEVGIDVNNPVPTKFVTGTNSYLSRVRTLDGNPISFERAGSVSAPHVENMIDRYSIKNSKGQDLGCIYISMYHKRNSKKAPAGFKLIPE
jgi:hypothetical protein